MFAWSTLPSFLTVLSFKTSINYVRRDQNTLTKQEDICRLSFCRLTWLPNWRGLQKSPGLCSHRAGKGAGRGLVPWSSTVPQRQNWGPEPSHLDWQLSVLLTCEHLSELEESLCSWFPITPFTSLECRQFPFVCCLQRDALVLFLQIGRGQMSSLLN